MTKKLIKEYVCSLYIDLDGDRVKEVVDQLNKLLLNMTMIKQFNKC